MVSYYQYFRYDSVVKEQYRAAFAEAVSKKCWSLLDVRLDELDFALDCYFGSDQFFGKYDEASGRFRIDGGINMYHAPGGILVMFENKLPYYFSRLYVMSFFEDQDDYLLRSVSLDLIDDEVRLPFSSEDRSAYGERAWEMPFHDDIDEYHRLLTERGSKDG